MDGTSLTVGRTSFRGLVQPNTKDIEHYHPHKCGFVAYLLYWIALNCIGVPNKAARVCI